MMSTEEFLGLREGDIVMDRRGRCFRVFLIDTTGTCVSLEPNERLEFSRRHHFEVVRGESASRYKYRLQNPDRKRMGEFHRDVFRDTIGLPDD